MLPVYFVFIAVAVRLMSSVGYIISVAKGIAKPSPLTWFFWTLTASITAIAQFSQGIITEALVSVSLAIGPLVIFILSLKYSKSQLVLTKVNIVCGLLALAGIVLWQITSNPVLAVIFCIISDASATIPTIIKSYKKPQSEALVPYIVSAGSMLLTAATIKVWDFLNYGFILYIFCINIVVVTAILLGRKSVKAAA